MITCKIVAKNPILYSGNSLPLDEGLVPGLLSKIWLFAGSFVVVLVPFVPLLVVEVLVGLKVDALVGSAVDAFGASEALVASASNASGRGALPFVEAVELVGIGIEESGMIGAAFGVPVCCGASGLETGCGTPGGSFDSNSFLFGSDSVGSSVLVGGSGLLTGTGLGIEEDSVILGLSLLDSVNGMNSELPFVGGASDFFNVSVCGMAFDAVVDLESPP